MRIQDVTEAYGDWPAIKVLVEGGANRTALLRELYGELQRRSPGFEGSTGDVFREMTGYPANEHITKQPLYNPYWGLVPTLRRNGELVPVGKQPGATVYRVVSPEGESRALDPPSRPPAPEGSQIKKPKASLGSSNPGVASSPRKTLSDWILESMRMLANAGVSEPSLDRIEYAARALGWDGNSRSLRSAAWDAERDGHLRTAGHGHYALREAAQPGEAAEDALAGCVSRLAEVVDELKDAVVGLAGR